MLNIWEIGSAMQKTGPLPFYLLLALLRIVLAKVTAYPIVDNIVVITIIPASHINATSPLNPNDFWHSHTNGKSKTNPVFTLLTTDGAIVILIRRKRRTPIPERMPTSRKITNKNKYENSARSGI
jgi:hypothetical protein